MSAPIKIALLRLSSLGDVIVGACVLPALRAHLEQKYPQGVHLSWIVDSAFGAVLEDSPCIDKLIYIDLKKGGLRAVPRTMALLRSLGCYHKLIDMQGLVKSALCGAMICKDEFWGFARDSIKEPLGSVCYTHKVHIPYKEHILKRNFALINTAFEIGEYDEKGFYANRAKAFGVSAKSQIQVEGVLKQAFGLAQDNKETLLLVLEASLESKSYPVDLFVQVITQLLDSRSNAQILLLQHSSNKAWRIKEHFSTQDRVFVLPILSMDCLKALMQRVHLVIGGDTGVTHLAWAMQRASLTLYGNTAPERFALNSPYNQFLCGSEKPSYQKSDFSISNITPEAICMSANTLLDSIRG